MKKVLLFSMMLLLASASGWADSLYVVGEVNGNSWAPNVGVPMTSSVVDGVETWTLDEVTVNDTEGSGYGYFCLATQLTEQNDEQAWNWFNGNYRLTPDNNNEDFFSGNSWDPNYGTVNFKRQNNGYSAKCAAGKYKLTVTLSNGTYKAKMTPFTFLYLHDQVTLIDQYNNGNAIWMTDLSQGLQIFSETAGSNTFYLGNYEVKDAGDGFGYFNFSTKLNAGANSADLIGPGAWDGTSYEGGNKKITEWNEQYLDMTVAVANHSVVYMRGYNGNKTFKCPAGNYEMTITKISQYNPWYELHMVPASEKLYVMGQVNDNDWDPSVGFELTFDHERNAYVGRITTSGDASLFNFSTKLGSTWAEIQDNRLFPVAEANTNWLLVENVLGVAAQMCTTEASVSVPAGTWDLYVSLEDNTFTINRVTPQVCSTVDAETEVATTFDLTSTAGWAYDDATKTITKMQVVNDPYGVPATFTFTATNTEWQPSTWKSTFENGMLYKYNKCSYKVSVDHKTGDYTHYINTYAHKITSVGNHPTTIGDLPNFNDCSAAVTQMIEQYGNAYLNSTIDGTQYNYDEVGITQDEITEIGFTYNVNDWDNYHFQKVTVRDDWMTSDIADYYGTYRGFKWRIMDEMVPVAYYAGIAYCRSINDARVPLPEPGENQTPYYFIDWTQQPIKAPNGTKDQYTNYNWIALHLSEDEVAKWNSTLVDDGQFKEYGKFPQQDIIIKPGSIHGTYMAWDNNTSNLFFAYLNPDMKLDAPFEQYESLDKVVETKRNWYDIWNLVSQDFVGYGSQSSTLNGPTIKDAETMNFYQDSIFLINPKRNEVCNIRDAKVGSYLGSYSGLWNEPIPYSNTDTCHLNGIVFVIEKGGDWLKEIFNHLQWRTGEVHQLRSVVVKVSNILGHTYSDHNEEYYKPDDHYYWPNYYEETVKYYGISPEHSLVIEPRTAGKYNVDIDKDHPTTIDEKDAAAVPVKAEFFDLMGRRSSTPFNGVNIVVVTYSDGTTATQKIVARN